MGRHTARVILSIAIISLFVYLASGLLLPVALGAVFAVLLFPFLEKLESWKFGTAWAAGILTLGFSALVLLPGVVLMLIATKAGVDQFLRWKESASGATLLESILNTSLIRRLIEFITTWFSVQVDSVVSAVLQAAQTAGLVVANKLASLLAQLPGIGLGLGIMIVSIYFFLVDGRKIVFFLRRNSVLDTEETERLILSTGGMCRSVILATVASGFAQVLVFMLGALLMGVDNTVLLAFVVFIASFIPLIGAAPITFGVALHQLFTVSQSAGIVMLVIAVIAGTIDNFVRPAVLKGAGNLHPLLAFIGAFGGLQVFGFPGVFLGPIVAGVCVVTIDNLTRAHSPTPG